MPLDAPELTTHTHINLLAPCSRATQPPYLKYSNNCGQFKLGCPQGQAIYQWLDATFYADELEFSRADTVESARRRT